MKPPSRKSCYNFRVIEIVKVIDGDTIDVIIDLGFGRLLGWLYIGDEAESINEQMIRLGYAWEYDGGTKKKDFQELREIRGIA